MKRLVNFYLIALFVSLFCLFEGVFAQSGADIKRGKEEYERTHPNEKTYFIEQAISLLDPADQIMPKAKAVTYERWEKIGGAVFGVLSSFSKDKFANKYFKEDGKFKQLITENLLTDDSSFQKFMELHKKHGFYKVTLWKAGYLMFYMREGREKKNGIYLIVLPVKPKLFEEV